MYNTDTNITLTAQETITISQNTELEASNVTIHADTIIHEGTIRANAQDYETAGYIELLANTLSIYKNGSIIEAKGANIQSEGGSVYINTLNGDTDYQQGALIDVSGGTHSGDAGFIEISAKNFLGYHGTIRGIAQPGYQGGSVLFDPYNIIIQAGGYDTVFGGDASAAIDEASTEHSGLNLTFDPSANGSFVGFADIWLQATNDITVNSDFNTDTATGGAGVSLRLDAGNDITINADITTTNADVALYADNNLTLSAGSDISAGSGKVYLYADADENNTGTLTRNASSTVTNSGIFYLKSASSLSTSVILVGGDSTTGSLEIYTTNDSNITIDSDISRTNQYIYFYADGNITQSANSDISAGSGNVYLSADTDENGTGTLSRNASSTVTNSGIFYLQSASNLSTSTLFMGGDTITGHLYIYTTNDKNITIDSDITRTNKWISFYSDGNLTQSADSDISAGSGWVYLYADADENGTGTLSRDASSTVSSSGQFYLRSASNLSTSTILLGGDTTTGQLSVYTTNDNNITIDSDISRTNLGIVFYSDGNLTQSANSDISAGWGVVYLYADYDENGTGTLSRDASSTVTNSGWFKLQSASSLSTSTLFTGGDNTTHRLYVYTTNDNSITIDSDISRTNQNIYFYSDGNLTMSANSDIAAGAGYVYLYADDDENGIGTLSRDASSTVTCSWNFYIKSASNLSTSTIFTGGDNVTGWLAVYTTNDNNITIDSDITRTNQRILFYSDGDLTMSANSDIAAGAGWVYLYADDDGNGIGTLSRDASSTVTNSQRFYLKSASNLLTSTLFTGGDNTTGELYIITTDDNNITIDSDISRTDQLISFNSSGDLTQSANSDIAAGANFVYLFADADENGTGTLSRDSSSTVTNSSWFSLQSASNLSTSTLFTGGDNVTGRLYVYTTNDNNMTIDSDISRTNQDIYFYSDGNLTLSANADISSGTGDIYLYADDDSNGTGAFDQASTSTVSGGSVLITTAGTGSILDITATGAGEDITVTATGGTVTLGDLTATDDISVTNTEGSFIDDGNAGTDLSGDKVTLTTTTDMGTSSNYIETDAATLEATTSNGSIYLEENDAVTLNPISAHNGSVNLSLNTSPTVTNMIGASGTGDNSINITVRTGTYSITSLGNANPEEGYSFIAVGDITITNALNAGSKDMTIQGVNVNINNTITAGDVNIVATGTLTINGGITLSAGAGSISIQGNYDNNGIFDAGTSTVTFNGAGVQTWDSNGTGDNNDFYNVIYSGSGTLRPINNNIEIDNNFTISGSGSLDMATNDLNISVAGNVDIAAGTYSAGAGTFTLANNPSNGTQTIDFNGNTIEPLTVNGTNDIKQLTGNLTTPSLTITNGTFDQGTGTLNISGNLSISNGAMFTKATGAQVLTFTGTSILTDSNATKQDLGAVTLNGTSLTLASDISATTMAVTTGTLAIGANALTTTGALSNNDTITIADLGSITTAGYTDNGTGTFTKTGTSAITFASSGNTTITGTFNHNNQVTLSMSGTSNLNASAELYDLTITAGSITQTTNNITIADDFNIQAGTYNTGSLNLTISDDLSLAGTLTANASTITVAGNWSNTGTFNQGTSNVIFNDASQTTTITGDTSFYTLTSTTAGKNITFTAASTQTITGLNTLTLQGQEDNPIVLRSSNEGDTWYIQPPDNADSINVSYVDVQDSENLGTITINPTFSIDSGNNIGWFLVASNTPPDSPEPTDTTDPDTGERKTEVDINMDELFPELSEDAQAQEDSYFVNYGDTPYDNEYRQGSYRTTVNVFDGEITMAPYNQQGPDYEKGTLIQTDESKSEELTITSKSKSYFTDYETQKKYKKRYKKGKYKTVVILFKGRVVSTPYNDNGPIYKEGTILRTGESATAEGDI